MSLQFVGVEAFITAVTDVFPEFLRGKGRREIFLAVCCVLKLLLGLYMVTEVPVATEFLFEQKPNIRGRGSDFP